MTPGKWNLENQAFLKDGGNDDLDKIMKKKKDLNHQISQIIKQDVLTKVILIIKMREKSLNKTVEW